MLLMGLCEVLGLDAKIIEESKILDKWSFSWSTLEVMIGGKSSIDLAKLRFKGWKDTTDFLKHYGFDPDNPKDARHIHAVIIESLGFIQYYLMPSEWKRGRKPPKDILCASDVRAILLAASDLRPENEYRQAWACALLRVMHTISHIEEVCKIAEIEVARSQIMERFRRFVFRDEEGVLRFGKSSNSIELHSVDWKVDKSRPSIIMKLLHKEANVSESIFDLLGVRLITKHLCDVMVAVKYLRDFHILTYVNCTPFRARNTLIDIESFRHNVEMLRKMYEEKRISLDEFNALMQQIIAPSSGGRDMNSLNKNPHTSGSYKSVQLTCRQLIHFVDPHLGWRQKLKILAEDNTVIDEVRKSAREMLRFTEHWQKDSEGRKSIFFPFEVQVLDEESYQCNLKGTASHDKYKKSQIRAARRRVLHKLLTLPVPVED